MNIPLWTRKNEQGQFCCAHCSHVFGVFNYLAILSHARMRHREFYRQQWEKEIVPTGQARLYPAWAPLPVSTQDKPVR